MPHCRITSCDSEEARRPERSSNSTHLGTLSEAWSRSLGERRDLASDPALTALRATHTARWRRLRTCPDRRWNPRHPRASWLICFTGCRHSARERETRLSIRILRRRTPGSGAPRQHVGTALRPIAIWGRPARAALMGQFSVRRSFRWPCASCVPYFGATRTSGRRTLTRSPRNPASNGIGIVGGVSCSIARRHLTRRAR